jgi:hypothetical protein
MLSYTTVFVLALAVSNVSPALSAPVPYGGLHLSVRVRAFLTMFNSSRQVREQSLGHRGPKIGAVAGKRAFKFGPLLKKIGIDLGIGTASTVAGYGALDAITGPSKEPATADTTSANSAPPTAPPQATSGPPPAATSTTPPTNSMNPPSTDNSAPDSSSSGSIFGEPDL